MVHEKAQPSNEQRVRKVRQRRAPSAGALGWVPYLQAKLVQYWLLINLVLGGIRSLPDLLTLKEIERLINGTRELRYQTFILVAFGMGLRLGEVLNLQVPDIDKVVNDAYGSPLE